MAESKPIFSKLSPKRRKYNTKTKEINANISELKWSTEIVYYCLTNNRNIWKLIRCSNSRTQRWAPGMKGVFFTTFLVQLGIYFDTFWKTHSCKWIQHWMRKVVWLLILPTTTYPHSDSNQQFLGQSAVCLLWIESSFVAYWNVNWAISGNLRVYHFPNTLLHFFFDCFD